MKRQFLRVKQIADQTFLRAEKSDVLTEDLVNAEKRVELIKQSCQNTGKKIANCLQGGGTDPVSIEKRQKKMPEILLYQAMLECSSLLGDSSIIGSTLDQCANIQEMIGKELLWYETEIEKVVLTPIVNMLQHDIPNIVKLRKTLNKLTLDMDSARNRYQTAIRHNSQQTVGSTSTNATSKLDALKEELEEASMKVEQCRDTLATEMFVLISREPEIAELYLQLYKINAEYHRKVLQTLEERIPTLTGHIRDFSQRPVFGCRLEEHLRVTDRQIAWVLEACIGCLLAYGLEEEGLFRIAGSASKIKKLKSAFDAGILDLTDYTRDPHSVAGVLKSYLRELPEPLLTFSLYDEWMAAIRIPEQDHRLQALWQVLSKLPEANFQNLRYLIKFLSKLAVYADVNKMSPQNIAIVMAPSLMWPEIDDGSTHIGMNMTVANLHSAVIDALVTYADWFFPGEVEFRVISPTSPKSIGESPPNSANDCMTTSVSSHSNNEPANGDVDIENAMNNNLNCSSTGTWSRSPKSLHRPSKKPAPPVPASVSDNSATERVTLRASDKQPSSSFEQQHSELSEKSKKHAMPHTKFATLHTERPDKPERRSLIHRRSSENLFASPFEKQGSTAKQEHSQTKQEKEDMNFSTSSLRRPLKMDKPEVPPHAQTMRHPRHNEKPAVPAHGMSFRHEKHQTPIERPSVPPPERPSKPAKPPKPPPPLEATESADDILRAVKQVSLTEIDFDILNPKDETEPKEVEKSKQPAGNEPVVETVKEPCSLDFVDDSDHDELHTSVSSLKDLEMSSSMSGSDAHLSRWDFLMSRGNEQAPERPPRGFQAPSEQSSFRSEFLLVGINKPVTDTPSVSMQINGTVTNAAEISSAPSSFAVPAETASAPSTDQKYCTVIQVGEKNTTVVDSTGKIPPSPGTLRNRAGRPQPPPPLPPNKPRVNTSSEDTKL